jgi:cell division protein FtsQ
MRINIKKTALITVDIIIAVYLVLAVTAFNNPDDYGMVCQKVQINIADETDNGFLNTQEIKSILEKNSLYPLSKPLRFVNPRSIEQLLKVSPFVNTAECYKTEDGNVCIDVTQRTPIVRIKSVSGDDYYIDDKGGIMPNSKYTSDLIIVTGYVSQYFARGYISLLAKTLMASDLWKNQIVQINVLPDKGIELVPRVGDHVVFIGYLPETKYLELRNKEVTDFVNHQLSRLEKFYKYGLSQAGWNKYSYISLEFSNQIICTKRDAVAQTGNTTNVE